MKILKYEKKKSNIYKVYLENDYVSLYDDVILKYNLLLKKSITPKELEQIVSDNNYYEAYYKSLKYINKKLRSKKEIIKYLKKDYEDKVVNYTLDRLENEKYLNEEIYANSYIHDAVFLTNKGYYKIQKELIELGIDENIITNKLDEIDDDTWSNKIDIIINKKIKTNKDSFNKFKNKLNHELYNLGYSSDMINSKLENIKIDDEDDILCKTYNKIYNKLSKKYTDKELELQIFNKLLKLGFNYDDIKKYLTNNG